MEQRAHYFFAAVIPDDVKSKIVLQCERMKGILPFRNWVDEQDYHITLAFLGGTTPEVLQDAVTKVEQAINEFEHFPLAISHLGVFGLQQSPRILWAGVEESHALQLLQNKVYKACEQAGFSLDRRPFHPHITLARKWVGEEAFEADFLDAWADIVSEPLVFKVNQLALYQTHLNSVPKYEPIQFFHK